MKVMLVKVYSLQVRKLRHREGKASYNIPDISPASPFSVMQHLAVQGTLQAGSPPQGLYRVRPLCSAHSPP